MCFFMLHVFIVGNKLKITLLPFCSFMAIRRMLELSITMTSGYRKMYSQLNKVNENTIKKSTFS